MPTEPLKLPVSAEAKLFRIVVKQLQDHAILKRVVKFWQVWDGSPNDTQSPTPAQLPWIGVRPIADMAHVEVLSQTETPVVFQIDVIVDGTNADDIMNLWNVVRMAIYPGNRSMWEKISVDGVRAYAVALSKPAYGFMKSAEGAQFLFASGAITIPITVETEL